MEDYCHLLLLLLSISGAQAAQLEPLYNYCTYTEQTVGFTFLDRHQFQPISFKNDKVPSASIVALSFCFHL